MNRKRIVILQPHFFPFVGYFELMQRADLFVYYDTAQFVKRSWHCRTYILENKIGRWLSLPVSHAIGSRCPISEIQVDDKSNWSENMCRRLSHIYGTAKEKSLLEDILNLIRNGPKGLSDWNISAHKVIMRYLGLNTPTVRTSELGSVKGDKLEKLLLICQRVGATNYICGPGSRFYVKDEVFADAGILVEWVNYEYGYTIALESGENVYPSIIDMIFRKGRDYALKELKNAYRR